jgi:uncharacterized YigZ family protein
VRTEHLLSTIAAPVTHELIVKQSRFITYLVPANNDAVAETVIAAIRKEHWKASHNCVALILGPGGEHQRSSDDGEPSGTAGVPMLEVLRRREMTDIVAVVTRYFGGTLLGAGGLIRAYSNAVSQALDSAKIVRRRWLIPVQVSVPFNIAGRVENSLRSWAPENDAVFQEPSYFSMAHFEIMLPPDSLAALEDKVATVTEGECEVEIGEGEVVDVVG